MSSEVHMHLVVTERHFRALRPRKQASPPAPVQQRGGGGAAVAATGLLVVGLALVHVLRPRAPKRKEAPVARADEEPSLPPAALVHGRDGRKSLHKVHWADAARLVLRLEVTSGAQKGHTFSLPPHLTVLNVGRVASNDFVINDTEVSSQHARIAWDDAQHTWQLMDLGSLNGTRLNGLPVGKPNRECGAWHALRHGDVIHFGERDESPAVAVALLPPPGGAGDDAAGAGSGAAAAAATPSIALRVVNSSSSSSVAGVLDPPGAQGTRRVVGAVAAAGPGFQDAVGGAPSSAVASLPPPYSALLPPPAHALRLPVSVRQDPARGRPCEDRSVVEFPLRGHPHCALLCVLDGHCGAGAAQQAGDLLPGFIARELARLPPGWHASPAGAGPALRAAFLATDAALRCCEYEGCAATAVLVWRTPTEGSAPPPAACDARRLMVQAANVGDCGAVLCAHDARWLRPPPEDARAGGAGSDGALALPPPALPSSPSPALMMPQTPPLMLTAGPGGSSGGTPGGGSTTPTVSPRPSGAGGGVSPLSEALSGGGTHVTLVLTQDHKVSTPHERERLKSTAGVVLKPSDNRLYGLSLARALGDHFLKGGDVACGLVAEPFVSDVAVVTTTGSGSGSSSGDGGAFLVAATDGLWDVTSPAAAVHMASAAGAGGPGGGAGCDAGAAALLAHARQKRSKDDCTVVCCALEACAHADNAS